MSHAEFRREAHRNHVEKMGRILHRETGGGVMHADKRQDEAMVRKALAEHDQQLHTGQHTKLKFAAGGGVDSAPTAARADRRARGGAAKKKGAHVNVIIAPQGGGGGGLGGPPPAAPAMAAPPPHPPMMPPPGPPGAGMPGAPGGMAGGPPIGAMAPHPMMPGGPPGMMPHARGGRAYAKGGRASGGAAEDDGPRDWDRVSLPKPGTPTGPAPQDEKRNGGRIAARARGGRAEGGAAKEGHPFIDPKLDMTVGGAKDASRGRDPEWTAEAADSGGKGDKLNKAIVPSKRAKGGAVGALEGKEPVGEGPIDDGAGSGEGRLEKMRAYGKNSDKSEGEMRRGGRAA